jgi:16S rRNA (cytosine1402-N4)-methyltransferase
LLNEVIEALDLKAGKTVVDATVGGAGHSQQIAKLILGGTLICIDRDQAAIEHSQPILKDAHFAHSDFVHIAKVLDTLGIKKIDAVLADLGVSSHQIDTPERGFSYMTDAPLDMRMDTTQELTAYNVVNQYPAERLLTIIRGLGEERYARRITEGIIKARPIKTTLELAEVCKSAVPGNYYKTGGHPAKRTFQAIRIHVNNELDIIEKFIKDSTDKLAKGGRIAIISFHSLEDRIVKQTFKTLATNCICPPRIPMCICGHKATLKILTKKPIEPTEAEIKTNPRSHSAKLRVAERI